MRRKTIVGMILLGVLFGVAYAVNPGTSQVIPLGWVNCCKSMTGRDPICCQNCCWFFPTCTTSEDCQQQVEGSCAGG
jgi:hypothetical protein